MPAIADSKILGLMAKSAIFHLSILPTLPNWSGGGGIGALQAYLEQQTTGVE